MRNEDHAVDAHYPHIHDWRSATKVSWICSLCLAPVIIWSVALYGLSAALVWLASIGSALISQLLVDAAFKRFTVVNGSFLLTGILVATTMPPTIAPFIPAASSAFAILIVKGFFGGNGKNWMNPALAGAAFAYVNWPAAMRDFVLPRALSGVDGLSAVTPLTLARDIGVSGQTRVMEALRQSGYPLSALDSSLTGFLNDAIFLPLGARLPEGYMDIALGLKPGTLGESALLVLLAGSIVLISLKLIKLEIPLAMIAGFALLARIFGTGLPGEELFRGDVLYALGSGGFLLAAFFMATDPVSSPVDRSIAALYGLAIGVLCYAFRRWGSYPEGVCFAVLIMNVISPTLERRLEPLLRPRAERTAA